MRTIESLYTATGRIGRAITSPFNGKGHLHPTEPTVEVPNESQEVDVDVGSGRVAHFNDPSGDGIIRARAGSAVFLRHAGKGDIDTMVYAGSRLIVPPHFPTDRLVSAEADGSSPQLWVYRLADEIPVTYSDTKIDQPNILDFGEESILLTHAYGDDGRRIVVAFQLEPMPGRRRSESEWRLVGASEGDFEGDDLVPFAKQLKENTGIPDIDLTKLSSYFSDHKFIPYRQRPRRRDNYDHIRLYSGTREHFTKNNRSGYKGEITIDSGAQLTMDENHERVFNRGGVVSIGELTPAGEVRVSDGGCVSIEDFRGGLIVYRSGKAYIEKFNPHLNSGLKVELIEADPESSSVLFFVPPDFDEPSALGLPSKDVFNLATRLPTDFEYQQLLGDPNGRLIEADERTFLPVLAENGKGEKAYAIFERKMIPVGDEMIGRWVLVEGIVLSRLEREIDHRVDRDLRMVINNARDRLFEQEIQGVLETSHATGVRKLLEAQAAHAPGSVFAEINEIMYRDRAMFLKYGFDGLPLEIRARIEAEIDKIKENKVAYFEQSEYMTIIGNLARRTGLDFFSSWKLLAPVDDAFGGKLGWAMRQPIFE